MLRDMFFAAIGAASLLSVFTVIMIVLKTRERAERHRQGVACSMLPAEWNAKREAAGDNGEFE